MRLSTKSISAALAASFCLSGIIPAAAAPAFVPQSTAATASDVVPVQMRRHDQRRERFERRNGRVYFNGHRGYRERRSGYRQHNGFWFPATAFITGAIIGSTLHNNRSAHVDWCANRWRSYHAWDNTYQPSNGPRRVCVSPYS